MSRRVLFFVWQAVNEKPPCVTQILALADMGTEVAVLTRNCSDEVMQEFRKRNIPVEYIRAKKCRNHLIQKAENYLNYRRRFRDFFRKYRTDDSILWVGSEQGVIRMWPFIRNIHPMVLDALEFYEEDWYQKGMRKMSPQNHAAGSAQNKAFAPYQRVNTRPTARRPTNSPIPEHIGSTVLPSPMTVPL